MSSYFRIILNSLRFRMRNNGEGRKPPRMMDLKSLFLLKFSMNFEKAANPQGCWS